MGRWKREEVIRYHRDQEESYHARAWIREFVSFVILIRDPACN